MIPAINRTSNNKSGILQGVFKDLSWFLVRSPNYSVDSGSLSITQNQGVITLLPKGQKPREFLKNWRPNSLLNGSYKLASACIANRLKSVLPDLIGQDECGFMHGRFRQIYDIMNSTKINNIPGLLLLVDFEKAFDPVFHELIFKILDIINFCDGLKKWIKVFYENAQSTVLVNGHMTLFFCKQGGLPSRR